MAKEMESITKRNVKHSFCFLIILVPLLLVTCVSAGETNSREDLNPSISHEIVLDALSWKAFPLQCTAGDTLSGEFILTNNGDLFVGDQTKYDNWLLGGINFLIIDAANYELWKDDLSMTSLYERKGVVELSWSIETPSEGIWYIVYYNDSIFMIQVEGSIQHISQSGFTYTLVTVSLLGIAFLLTLIFTLRMKK